MVVVVTVLLRVRPVRRESRDGLVVCVVLMLVYGRFISKKICRL